MSLDKLFFSEDISVTENYYQYVLLYVAQFCVLLLPNEKVLTHVEMTIVKPQTLVTLYNGLNITELAKLNLQFYIR